MKPESTTDWSSAQDDLVTDSTTEEMAQLKVKYGAQLKTLKDVFPDWTTEDLVYALQEVDGDLDMATDRITGGNPFLPNLHCPDFLLQGEINVCFCRPRRPMGPSKEKVGQG